MTISKTGFEQSLRKALIEKEPIVKNVTNKVTNSSRSSPEGVTEVVTKEQKADVYMDPQMARSLAKAIAFALEEHNISYVNNTLVPKLNELITGYNQLRLDLTAALIPVTALPVSKLPE
jgi:hypothetical protein